MRIAVLLTCHNRRATTLDCLAALSMQCLPDDTRLTVYLVDDGSTDGTATSIGERFPEVRVVRGDGSLYWCGGMRRAWSEAMAGDYDGYLWLNDDTRLLPTAVATLLMSCEEASSLGRPGIVVGSTCDPDDGRLTYGGYRGLRRVEPSDEMQACDTMNGNIVLVPRGVCKAMGNLSPEFRHNSADQDYGLSARKAGFEIWVAPGLLGQCRRNLGERWADPKVPFRQRWRSLQSPKGQPLRETYIFCRRHNGWRWPLDILKLCCRVLLPGPWESLKRAAKKV